MNGSNLRKLHKNCTWEICAVFVQSSQRLVPMKWGILEIFDELVEVFGRTLFVEDFLV